MRLHRIELTGFGPFLRTQAVDFDAFADDGIFLIAGRTGAGKSSILDGVTFALYGGVPRYESGERRVRSDYCTPDDPTEVRLELTVGERRLRVARSPEYERPAKRGGGLTTTAARAQLDEFIDGGWRGIAARPRDVALALDEILGLSQQQFQQVILLAQNRFSRFLLAGNADRQALLRTLFDSRRFEQYRDALEDRRRQMQRRLEEAGAQTRTLLEVAERLIDETGLRADDEEDAAGAVDAAAAVDAALERAAYRVQQREREQTEAQATHAAAAAREASITALWRSQQELSRVREAAAAREAESPAIARAQTELHAAHAADALRPVLSERAEAEKESSAAASEQEGARSAWEQIGSGDAASAAERLGGELALWAVAAAQEERLPDVRAEAERAAATVVACESELIGLEHEQQALPELRSAREAELAETTTLASRLDHLRAERDRRRERLAAAIEAERLRAVADLSAETYRIAAERSAATATTVAELLRRRLSGHAAELASDLVPGRACPVCGSLEHPRPAVSDDEPVTDELFAAAEAARDEAAGAERGARDAAGDTREAHTAAHARAGGAIPADAERELAVAASDLLAAQRAEERRSLLVDALAELRRREDAVVARVADVRTRLGDAREGEAVAADRLAAADAEVMAARGDHDSVAARIAHAQHARDAARRLLVADDELSRAVAVRQRQSERADAAIAASPFEDAAAASAAVRTAQAQAALSERIAAHAAAREADRRRLRELESELVGTDPADPAAASAALDAAAASWTAAVAAHRSAVDAQVRLRDLAGRIEEARTTTGGIEAEAAAVGRLADTVAGRAPNTMKMDLETFVLAAELEEVVAAANVRLREMSAGRYELLHTDARAARGASSGLGIEVMDAHTGRARSPQSLSGGETFLASLALALGLAEVVTARAGGIRLDTLFIDEGFGSLDAETLELAMRTLDELRAGGRVVGVISHVETMREQLGAQVRVDAAANGPSVIRQDSAGAAPELVG